MGFTTSPLHTAAVSRTGFATVVLIAAISAIYLPAVGHGFVKDDFLWISTSRIKSPTDVGALLKAGMGFFRPLVSASFAANEVACGLRPFCYGVTNFGLLIACGVAIYSLARVLLLPPASALAAAAIWSLNFHGINMAVLWISGRTALLLVLAATLCAGAFVRRRSLLTGLFALAAFLSKEEAVALPVILVGWSLIDSAIGVRREARRSWPAIVSLAVALGCYFLLRSTSGAFTPATAPPFYRLSFTLERLLLNVPQYADRGVTFSAAAYAAFWLICRPSRFHLERAERSALAFGTMWLVGGFGLTVFLPVRSSLYACFPSVGAALCTATLMATGWRTTTPQRRLYAVAIGLTLPFILWPVYHSRNRRAVSEAELSTRTLRELQIIGHALPPGAVVLLHDDRQHRPSLDDTFGTLIQPAVDLTIGPQLRVWVDPPPRDAAIAGLQAPARFDLAYSLEQGTLRPAR